VVAGLLWDRVGPSATFIAGASISVLSLVFLALIRLRQPALGARVPEPAVTV
jgi:hypothetical protein